MLKICTVYFGDLYTPDYVGKLFDSIRRNSSIPFQSVCISDNPNVEADIVLPYNHFSDVKKHWHKLKFFSPHFAESSTCSHMGLHLLARFRRSVQPP